MPCIWPCFCYFCPLWWAPWVPLWPAIINHDILYCVFCYTFTTFPKGSSIPSPFSDFSMKRREIWPYLPFIFTLVSPMGDPMAPHQQSWPSFIYSQAYIFMTCQKSSSFLFPFSNFFLEKWIFCHFYHFCPIWSPHVRPLIPCFSDLSLNGNYAFHYAFMWFQK